MMDLKEPTFTLVGNPSIRIGYCAIVIDDHVVYAGPIRDAVLAEGDQLFIHPDDFKTLEKYFKKHQH